MIALIIEQRRDEMPDYQAMYIVLFQAVTRAIATLQEAQKQAEELYLGEEPVKPVKPVKLILLRASKPEDKEG